jgi:hypothetical protein
MKKSRRIFFPIFGIILISAFLLWLIPWVDNGGWPASGPVGNSLPPNIQHVMPRDGEKLKKAYGFCVHYDYRNGSGMDEASQETPRYYFDGRNVTQHTYDIVSLEYPTQVAEPCYQRSELISPGWHTVKVSYQDTSGNRYEYKWRFQITDEE